MSQNSLRLSWTRDEVDNRLHLIMKGIHQACVETAERFGTRLVVVQAMTLAQERLPHVIDEAMEQVLAQSPRRQTSQAKQGESAPPAHRPD